MDVSGFGNELSDVVIHLDFGINIWVMGSFFLSSFMMLSLNFRCRNIRED